MKKMTVAEAMPKKMIRLFRVIRGILVLGCCLFLVFFVKREKGIMEEYREIYSYLQRMTEYGRILTDAAASYEGGDLAASERFYLQILSEGLTDTQPYLGLADIYCDRRLYEKALEILQTYPEENTDSAISERIKEIEELLKTLERSQFLPVE